MPADPEWLGKLDGSLPSRILDYMYLGNLNHANNPALLRELGIGRIVSVGEKVNCPGQPVSEVKVVEGGPYDGFEFIIVENVQDNGVDSLSEEFERCLDFIGTFSNWYQWVRNLALTQLLSTERGKKDGIATLVHCRVGVSRSATICIAEVMKELGYSFPRA
jgi:dual specificity MAP kinase phosphatase